MRLIEISSATIAIDMDLAAYDNKRRAVEFPAPRANRVRRRRSNPGKITSARGAPLYRNGSLSASAAISATSAASSRRWRSSAIASSPALHRSRAGRAASDAKRFAAKEACAKALGTGLGHGVFCRDMGVVDLPAGKPTMHLTAAAAARLAAIPPAGAHAVIHLTITDEAPLAQASVVIEALPEG